MNEPYTHISGVRRRPRTDFHQKSRPETHGRESHSRSREEKRESRRDQERWRNRMAEEERRRWESADPRRALPYYGEEEEPGFRLPFDPLRLFVAVKRNWRRIAGTAAVLGFAGLLAGILMVDYKVNVPLLRKKTPNAFERRDELGPREYSDQTLFAFMKSGPLLTRVALQAATNPVLSKLKVTPGELAGSINIRPSPNPDVIQISLGAFENLGAMVELANIYTKEVVDYTREIQSQEARDLDRYLQTKLAEADSEVAGATLALGTNFVGEAYGDFEQETDADLKRLLKMRDELGTKLIERDTLKQRIETREEQLKVQTPANAELAKAEADLEQMLTSMTEKHPLVAAKKQTIEMLRKMQSEKPVQTMVPGANPATKDSYTKVLDMRSDLDGLDQQITSLGVMITNLQTRLAQQTDTRVRYAMKSNELKSRQGTQAALAEKQRQAQLLAENAMGYFSVLAPATMSSIDFKQRWLKVLILGITAAMLGFVGSVGCVMVNEAMDTTLKTPEDVTRITHLPVLATLGDLRRMSPAAQVSWAFRTLTVLRGKLSAKPDQAMVCGIISCGPGEGRSTWVNLLVSAASQRGLRVLTVDTRPSADSPETSVPPPAKPKAAPASQASEQPVAAEPVAGEAPPEHLETTTESTTETNVLTAPATIAEQLVSSNSQSVVHIPLPGWVWNLERRKQWQKALEYWRNIDNLVIFVELPPASQSESVLLSEHVPQLIWLTGSGMADAAETATHLDTLRHAGCNLVGAVLNQAPPPVVNTKLARWFTRAVGLFLLGALLTPARAQERPQLLVPPEAKNPPLTFSAAQRKQRAAWQERLTFGPGDTMDIHLFGNPNMTRTNIFVGPDGRISYLQAQGVLAAGFTVEELRSRLDESLAEFYVAPRTIVIPVAFTSKKYYMLGKVSARGVYQLDRPVTIVEAVARARGLETGMYQRTTVEMADLAHSFLVREGKRLPVNFEKLFLEGDLSQNVTLEPNDYLFFASASANDIYVLGEVMNPGPIGYLPNATLISAVTDRGGFADSAYKRRVLVVRGSLNQPETFAVDTWGILDGRDKDFPLQPKDIVYVSKRPWIKVEELADEAMQSFIQGAVTTWSGVSIAPLITSPFIPSANK